MQAHQTQVIVPTYDMSMGFHYNLPDDFRARNETGQHGSVESITQRRLQEMV